VNFPFLAGVRSGSQKSRRPGIRWGEFSLYWVRAQSLLINDHSPLNKTYTGVLLPSRG